MGSSLFTPVSETCLPYHLNLGDPQFLNDIWCKLAAPNFTHIRRETWKLPEEIHPSPSILRPSLSRFPTKFVRVR